MKVLVTGGAGYIGSAVVHHLDELGWAPAHPDLHDIVASAWAWHRSHPNGYGS